MLLGNFYIYSEQTHELNYHSIGFLHRFGISVAWTKKQEDWWNTKDQTTGFLWTRNSPKRKSIFLGRLAFSLHLNNANEKGADKVWIIPEKISRFLYCVFPIYPLVALATTLYLIQSILKG